MLQAAIKGMEYGVHVLEDMPELSDALKDVSPDVRVGEYLNTYRVYTVAAMGLWGRMFYDIAKGNEGSGTERRSVSKVTAQLLMLTDIVDDVLDTRASPLEDKFSFLDRVNDNLFGYGTSSSTDLPEEASYVLARRVYADFLHLDEEHRVEHVFQNLVGAVKEQFIAKDPDHLLDIAKTIGSCCADSVAVLVEIVAGESFPSMRSSARRMGAYGQIVDNWYETDEDLAEGANTYSTALISERGDSKALRKELRHFMLAEAQKEFDAGLVILSSPSERRVYRSLKFLVDLKYKVVSRFLHQH